VEAIPSDDDTTIATAVPVPGERTTDAIPAGTMLGEYRIEAPLARGGMGMVFAAVHPVIGKRAAIKILSRELCSDPATVARFVDEARVVNQIGHPNIVDVFAFGAMPDGRQYLVMELLQGETLGARLARQPLALVETCAILKQLARALAAAHEHGVIHRDLKPDNVFLVALRGEAPVVKLLDFGIAKLSYADHRVARTAAGAVVGTPQYIAPEQARGHRVDTSADVYAFGGMLFELLTGRPPFLADNASEMIAKHLMEPAPRPSDLAPVAPELDALVVAMLDKDPLARPTLDQVCDALDRAAARASAPQVAPAWRPSAPIAPLAPLASGAPVGALAGHPSTLPGPASRRRLGLAVVAAVAVAMIAFAAAMLARRSEAPPPLAPAATQPAVAPPAVKREEPPAVAPPATPAPPPASAVAPPAAPAVAPPPAPAVAPPAESAVAPPAEPAVAKPPASAVAPPAAPAPRGEPKPAVKRRVERRRAEPAPLDDHGLMAPGQAVRKGTP
jgi:serine/threonine-protein kinase